MATLTPEQQSLIWAVGSRGVAAPGTGLAGVVRIDFDRHTARKPGFVGDVALQFSKGPLGGMSVCLSLLLRGFFAVRAFGALADMCQVLQADDAVWVRIHNTTTDTMVASLFQPSLSSAQHEQASCSGTSAFLLQPFSQSRIVVSYGSDLFAGIKAGVIGGRGSDGQIALSHIDAYHLRMAFGAWVCYFQLKGHEQVKLLVGLVIPELGGSDSRAMLEEGNMLAISRIGYNHAPIQGQDTHLVIWLQTVIPMIVIGQRGRHVLGWSIQSLVAFRGYACRTKRSVLLRLRPQDFVGSPDLAGDIAGHLSGQPILQTYLLVASALQGALITHLAVRETVLAHRVQGSAIRQLRVSQCLELGRGSQQFQLGGDDRFHERSIPYVHTGVKQEKV